MKDITDYFPSPNNTRKASEGLKSPKPKPKLAAGTSDQNLNTDSVIRKDVIVTETVKEQAKIGKKKRRRKHTDPEVRNVTELLSNTLNLISPNASGLVRSPTTTKKGKSSSSPALLENLECNNSQDLTSDLFKCERNQQSTIQPSVQGTDIIQCSIDKHISDSKSPNLTPKVNAFQFLMNSRNNIIGQNSDGKTGKEENVTVGEGKDKLEARKNLFMNWADQKGASKRKREEEDIEKCINVKLGRRAKRLRKLLKVDEDSGKKDNHGPEICLKNKKPDKKKVRRLVSSSESENSNDLTSDLTIQPSTGAKNTSMVKITSIIEENAQDAIISTVTSLPQKKHKENGQNSLLNFFGVITKKDKEDIIEVFEESGTKPTKEIIKIKMFTPQSTKKRTSLMALNRHRTGSIESLKTDESSQEDRKVKHKKKKHKSKEKNLKNDTKLNDSMEDFCSPNDYCLKKEVQKVRHKELDLGSVANEQNKIDDVKRKASGKASITNVNTCLKTTNKNSIVNAEQSRQFIMDDSIDLVSGSTEHSPIKLVSNRKAKVKKRETSSAIATEEENIVVEVTKGEGRVLRRRNIYRGTMTTNMPKSPKKCKENHKISAKNFNISNRDESVEKVELSSDSDYEELQKKGQKTSVKVAPVFLKTTPKVKANPGLIEARKQFLLSGIPDTLKKTVVKQKSFEEKEFDVFPCVSHIQQKCSSHLWKLPDRDFSHLTLNSHPLPIDLSNLKCQNLIVKVLPYQINLNREVKKVKHLKSVLQEIKSQNPDYPVYKVFRHVYEKSGKHLENSIKSKQNSKMRSKKLKRKSVETSVETQGVQSELVLREHEMWTEKYNPRSSEEILGNYRSVNNLKKWLQMWMNYSEEINARKRKRPSRDSESEFESTDCDSRDSTRLPGNTIILYGPSGSGKTSAVYAIANELGFNVLELNASTKRTGKRLLQELQEATQSHQVRKGEANLLSNFMNPVTKRNEEINTKKKHSKGKLTKKSNSEENKSDQKDLKKMCILFLEDIDLIFEQDERFLSSLAQLILTSKRPIILTTTDNSPPHVQKFISEYECIYFMPLSLQCLAVWLQIVCLVEGLLVDKDDLGNLLEYNKGDIRKTLLQVQFWCQSGGQLEKNRAFPLKTDNSSGNPVNNMKAPDEELKIEVSEDEVCAKENFVHKHCLGSFEIFRVNEEYSIPEKIDLGMLWWNLPNILDVPSDCSARLRGQNNSHIELLEETDKIVESMDELKLNSLSNIYDSLILTDTLLKAINYKNSNEPIKKNWSVEVLDSQELTEKKQDCNVMVEDLVHDLSHTYVNRCVGNYRRLEDTCCALNMALPDSSERRWRANQHISEDFLKSPIPLSNILDRRSIALDYLPLVRDIARSEEKRAASNTKRGNRFRHYLKDLDMDFKQSTCKLACNILNIE